MYYICNTKSKDTMKTTMTFTEDHITELKRIATLNVFASKVAQTLLSREEYRASAKQVDIINEISDLVFFISDGYSNIYADNARQRTLNSLPSSMR